MKLLSNKKNTLFLMLMVLVALWFRTIGVNWDQNQHLHPDERFLTMVTERLEIPKNILEYLDPNISPMNPYNKDTGFYVYGVLPLLIVKIASLLTNQHTYDGIAITGRFMSAFFDIGTLVIIYKLIRLITKKAKETSKIALFGAFVYATMVLPIQLSHFYTVDSFLVFFSTSSVYFASLYRNNKQFSTLLVSAVLLGWAVACKISAIYVLPLLVLILMIPDKRLSLRLLCQHLFAKLPLLILYGLFSYVALRFADPHLFQSASFLNPLPAQKLVANMKELAILASDNAGYFPPAVQWFNTPPVTFALVNMSIFGVGTVATLGPIAGIIHLLRQGSYLSKVVVGFVFGFFLYQSTRFSPSMRYFYIIYPFLAMFCAQGLWQLTERLRQKHQVRRVFSVGVTVLLLLIYPIGFVHVYSVPHSRVSASYWINENLPKGATITMEHWDDGLPLRVPDGLDKSFNVLQLPVFAEDNQEKWTQMQEALNKADYVIMSSNRGYGSIMRQKKMYPIMSLWYEDLFAGKLSYVLLKEFTSFPTWCIPFTNRCVEFDDQWSEEAFTVYDHPKVSIFKKIK